jgi:hypothetical protein
VISRVGGSEVRARDFEVGIALGVAVWFDRRGA